MVFVHKNYDYNFLFFKNLDNLQMLVENFTADNPKAAHKQEKPKI